MSTVKNWLRTCSCNLLHFMAVNHCRRCLLILQWADAMLVTLQNDPVLSLTVPGKVQSYMASGKPIIGAINGETAEIIRDSGCGFCAQAEDYMGLADCVRRFVNEDDKSGFGKRALSYYEDQFDRKHFYEVLNTVLGENIDS